MRHAATVLATVWVATVSLGSASVVAANPKPTALQLETSGPQGTDFWLMYMAHREGARQALYLTGDKATNGLVSMPGLAGSTFSQPFSVVPGVTTFVQLPPEASMSATDTLADRGVHVVANGPISVVAVDYAGASSAAWLAMPTSALGTRHIVLAHGGPGIRAGSEFGVAATQAGTVLSVTPSQAAQGHAAGITFQVVLGPGQTWQLRSSTDGGDLSGSSIESSAPIAVFAGHSCADLGAGGASGSANSGCDLVADAMPPIEAWARIFLAMPLLTPSGESGVAQASAAAAPTIVWRIVAAHDDTQLRFDGEYVATLARGQVWQRASRDPAWISASQPALVAQFASSPTTGAVELVVPPFEQYRSSYTFGTPDLDHVVDIVVNMGGIGGIVVDATAVAASRFRQIGDSDFFGAQVPLMTEGAHTVTGTSPFSASVQWSGKGGAYAYSAGQSWAPLTFTPPLMCDADNDGLVTSADVARVLAARGTRVHAGDMLDVNRDGVIDVVDARRCALLCTRAGCAD